MAGAPSVGARDDANRMRPRRSTRAPGAPPSPAGAVARFVLASVVAILVIVVGAGFVLRQIAVDEAERDARARILLEGRLVETAGLTDGILRGDPEAIAAMDDVAAGTLLTDDVVRIKLWSADGRVLYADDPQLIGQRFPLGEDERELLRTGGADVELSDLSRPESASERGEGDLIESYTAVRTPSGEQVLFENYRRLNSVMAPGEDLLRALTPPLLAGLGILLLVQVPLAWSMAQRLRRQQEEREALLTGAIDAAAQERARIAAHLHDGPVQELAGVAFGLAPLADGARSGGDAELADALDDVSAHLRQGVRDLRAMMVELHPAALRSAGLAAALADLLSPLERDGVRTELEVTGPGDADPRDPLLYQVAREALRNAQHHARAATVAVTVHRAPGEPARLEVADDGRGFSPEDRAARRAEGHLGLDLLERAAADAGADLRVRSVPGEGTTVTLEVPAP